MRVLPFALPVLLAVGAMPVLAQDPATDGGAATNPSAVILTSSISINLPIAAADSAARQAEEDKTRRDLYVRSARECDLLLDSIAATCAITSINVSSQINSTPGQADYLYASSTINLEIALK